MRSEEFEKIFKIEQSNWWYLSRKRITQEWVRREAGSRNDLKILDIASACGMNFLYFGHLGRIVGVDISSESIAFCRKRGIENVIQADATKLPFEENSFDAILAFDALEHFEDDRLALRGFYKVLKPGGKLFINAPALMALWSPHDIAFHHMRRYSASEIKEKLEDCGFMALRMSYWSCFLMPFVYLLRKGRNSFYAKKIPQKSDFFIPLPSFIEKILDGIQRFELWFIKKGINFPFGVSLICSAYKK